VSSLLCVLGYRRGGGGGVAGGEDVVDGVVRVKRGETGRGGVGGGGRGGKSAGAGRLMAGRAVPACSCFGLAEAV